MTPRMLDAMNAHDSALAAMHEREADVCRARIALRNDRCAATEADHDRAIAALHHETREVHRTRHAFDLAAQDALDRPTTEAA